MRYTRFLSFSIFGGIGWVTFMTLLGYSLGKVPLVQKYFDLVVLAIIGLSLVPAALQILKSRRGVAAS
jgi:membrane-associated protein